LILIQEVRAKKCERGNGKGRIDLILIISRLRPTQTSLMRCEECASCISVMAGRRFGVWLRGKVDSTRPVSDGYRGSSRVPRRTCHRAIGERAATSKNSSKERCAAKAAITVSAVSPGYRAAQDMPKPSLYDFVEYRRNRKDDAVRPGNALRLTFDSEVLAPFAIGYCSHLSTLPGRDISTLP